jgi:hypothetical protein
MSRDDANAQDGASPRAADSDEHVRDDLLPDDEQLLGGLRRIAAEADPPPVVLREAARGAFAWRDVERELAELVYDSTEDDTALAGLRSDTASWLLTFEAEISVEVEVVRTGTTRRLVGQIVPPQEGRIEVRHASGVTEVAADPIGRFACDDVARGPVSLRCRVGGRIVDTEWVAV